MSTTRPSAASPNTIAAIMHTPTKMPNHAASSTRNGRTVRTTAKKL